MSDNSLARSSLPSKPLDTVQLLLSIPLFRALILFGAFMDSLAKPEPPKRARPEPIHRTAFEGAFLEDWEGVLD